MARAANVTGTNITRAVNMASEMLLEVLYPTRCAVCDAYGKHVLCPQCERKLLYIDTWKACPQCGSPFGIIQCADCNNMALQTLGLERLPTERIASALILDEAARRIVTIYKDSDERRLADKIAQIMNRYIMPECVQEQATIAYIPDSQEAFRRRGFDHGLEIAQALSKQSNLNYAQLFNRPHSSDQRKLSKRERIANMRTSITIRAHAPIPESVLIIDDVFTTGSTIFSAVSALKDAGVTHVRALTFARAF